MPVMELEEIAMIEVKPSKTETTESRLENALIDFIEQETKKPSSEKHVEVIPQMAQVLIKLLSNKKIWG